MDNKFDVIIIGAGILGASVAANMAEAGYSTLIIMPLNTSAHSAMKCIMPGSPI